MPIDPGRDGFGSKLLWTVAGVFLGLVVAWFGLGDFRIEVPWAAPPPGVPASPSASPSAPTTPKAHASKGPRKSPTAPGVTEAVSTQQPVPEPSDTVSETPAPVGLPSTSAAPEVDVPTTAAAVPFRMWAAPDSVTNEGSKMVVYFQVEGARPGAGLDVEVAGLQDDQGGACAKFSGQGCTLISGGYGEADRHGEASIKVNVYPCAMIDFTTNDPGSVPGEYRAWVKDRRSGKVRSATFAVVNAADLPPVESWQGGQCIT